jgi:hypothetical protein
MGLNVRFGSLLKKLPTFVKDWLRNQLLTKLINKEKKDGYHYEIAESVVFLLGKRNALDYVVVRTEGCGQDSEGFDPSPTFRDGPNRRDFERLQFGDDVLPSFPRFDQVPIST